MGGRNFLMGNYPHTPLFRSWDAISLQGEQAWFYELHRNFPQAEWETQGKLDKLALREGVRFIRDNPGLTLKRDLVKLFQFWGLERELIAGAGRGYFGRLSTPPILLLTSVIFGSYAAAAVAGIFGIVMTTPFAASALAHARDIWRRRGERSFRIACGVSCLLILGWLCEITIVERARFFTVLHG